MWIWFLTTERYCKMEAPGEILLRYLLARCTCSISSGETWFIASHHFGCNFHVWHTFCHPQKGVPELQWLFPSSFLGVRQRIRIICPHIHLWLGISCMWIHLTQAFSLPRTLTSIVQPLFILPSSEKKQREFYCTCFRVKKDEKT